MLQETRHTTGADGTYAFEIPPDQYASPYLYIELDVEHPDYAPRDGFGYALSMIRKNEKLNERPFFEMDRAAPGPADHRAGRDARGPSPRPGCWCWRTRAPTRPGARPSSCFTQAKTDAQGRFRLPITTPGQGAYWVKPKDYAPELYVVPEGKRGDMGTITLKKGVSVAGRVLDVQGKPIKGVFVAIERQRGTGPDLEAQDLRSSPTSSAGSAETDADGRFTFAPLPPGEYQVKPSETNYDGDRKIQWTHAAIARGLRPREADDQGGRDPRPAGDPRVALGRDRGALGR